MERIKTTWAMVKSFAASRSASIQYLEFDSHYDIMVGDDYAELSHYMIKNPSDTTDLLDFETNYKPTANKPKDPKDADGSPLQRIKITKQGWTQFNAFIEFQASNPVVQHSKTKTMVDGWATVKCYKLVDAAYVECVDAADALANCVRTILDWEPDCDYEIIGGEIRALDRPTSNFRVRVVAVPDIPYASGGSKVMGSGVNLHFYNARESVHADGRSVKMLTYNAVYHTNKIRFIADHAQGDATKVMIKMESYMA